jgi:hypothetical protein
MRKAKALFLGAVTVAGVLAILLQHEQNRQLVQELEGVREANAKLESSQAAPNPEQAQSASNTNSVEELQSELVRLRGAATRAARAETEIAQLRKELERLRARTPSMVAGSSSNSDTLSAYLGTAVEPPPNLDPAYSKDGLSAAIQVAAQKAGISLKKVGIDDSEFPFLIGIVSEPGDWGKLKTQLSSLEGYEFHGSVGDDTSHTFSIVPSRAFPPATSAQVNRRMNTRLQLFYDSFTAQQN